ncbi:MAG: MmgE/PrpD family protein [Pseudomonadota bacterium]
MSGQNPNCSITERLAWRLKRPVDAPARERAARHVLDWTACALAGARSEPARAMSAALGGQSGSSCTVVSGDPQGALDAVMINGALGNVLEMDDVDKRAILHPGPTVIPAALAACELYGGDALAFLDAVVRGYEAVIRLGRAVGPGHYAYWHNTGTCGPFGAAAAAASAFGLDAGMTAHALGLAGTQASGFWQTRHEAQSMAKQLHTARAAHAGLSAAMLARSGFKGPLQILEGPQGFFAATCPGGDPDAVLVAEDENWAMFDVSFKPWPACRHAHAAIDAALEARERLGERITQIQAIEVATYSDAVTFCDNAKPDTVLEAKFSLQHAIAAALLIGPLDLSHFEPAMFNAPHLRALAAKVSVRADERFNQAYPARYGAALAIALPDGGLMETQALDALGDPENPLPEAVLIDKVRMLAEAGGCGSERLDRLLQTAFTLPQGGMLAGFTSALAGADRP